MNVVVRSPSLVLTSLVAAVFSLVVCGLLVLDGTRRLTKIPLDSPEFLVLKEQFLKDPQSDALKKQIRDLDFTLRQEYFREQRFTKSGVFLLLAGVVVMLISGKWAATLDRKLPHPTLKSVGPDSDERLSRQGLWAVGVVVVSLLVTIWSMYSTRPSHLPPSLEALAALRTAAAGQAGDDGGTTAGNAGAGGGPTVAAAGGQSALLELPAAEVFQQSWPRFRGPNGAGISTHTDVPTAWNGESGDGIVWKTAIPLPGVSSPIVWHDRIFLTGATEERREVYCFSAADGALLWQQALSAKPGADYSAKVNQDTGYAAPTMATDGRAVYAMFASGQVAGFDFTGRELWQVALGPLKNTYGHAASLDTYQGWVIVQADQGEADAEESRVLALDGETGRVIWQAKRKMPSSWSSPVVVEHAGQTQVITCGDPFVVAYAAQTGLELWRASCFPKTEIGPSPIVSDGIAYVCNEYAKLTAIRIDGSGDVTESHLAWQAEDGLPDACSPLVADKFLLLLASFGTLTCYDKSQGGDPLWEEDFEEDFTSSPSLVDGKVLLIAKSGKAWFVQPTAEECQRLGEANLGEGCVTSPAFQQGRMYLRGETHLFCIGAK